MDQVNPNVEMPRPVDVSDLPSLGHNVPVQATAAECAALCRRFGLVALQDFSARLRVERARTRGGVRAIRVHGAVSAEVRQICVLTLESFTVQVADELDIYFVPPTELEDGESDLIDNLNEEILEPLAEPEIDVGELAAQHLALALDPHPRRPGAAAQPGMAAANEANAAEETENPFAILGQLKHKM